MREPGRRTRGLSSRRGSGATAAIPAFAIAAFLGSPPSDAARANSETHWAFIPVAAPELPAVPAAPAHAAHNPVDSFVLARLRAAGLAPAEPADRRALIRRVTFDLTGLPPAPEEVAAFLADTRPGAYGRLVDRLLASPRYGEHTALPWLEASRYADTDGYQNDRYRYHWAWREWLVQALNENLPYDQFVVQQLAGDLLPGATLRDQVATGFCRNHRINSEAGSIAEEWHAEYVADRVEALGTVFLGLTLACARCHDHKYDPVSQRDYYRLFAYFNNVPEYGVGPNNGNSPPYVAVPEGWPLSSGDEPAREPAPISWQKAGYSGGVQRPVPGDKTTVMVMHELEEPRATYLLKRGLYNDPDRSETLSPAVPPALDPAGRGPTFAPDRLGLASWLVDPENPLTARVAVNRYWQHFFGAGLVRTSDNLGLRGEAPSHPALLDWLAAEFVRTGWDVKAVHRTIVTSATYRRSSRAAVPGDLALDPEDRLLARAPRRRHSAQALRDAALAAGGLLVERLHGPPAKPYMPPRIWRAISNNSYQRDTGANLYRRSLYTYWRRTIPPPTMMTLNAGDREVCTVRTARTNTPLQALTLLNNITFVEAARHLAGRLLHEAGPDPSAQVEHAFAIVLARPPEPEETRLLTAEHGRALGRFAADPQAAQALLKTGESPPDPRLDPAHLAAATVLANIVLNLDEAVTVE